MELHPEALNMKVIPFWILNYIGSEREGERERERETDRESERQNEREREIYIYICICAHTSIYVNTMM